MHPDQAWCYMGPTCAQRLTHTRSDFCSIEWVEHLDVHGLPGAQPASALLGGCTGLTTSTAQL